MKRKEIEKIPWIPAEKNMDYPFTAAARVLAVSGEEHLLVDVYEKSKDLPILRMAYTGKDWGMLYPETRDWRKHSVKDCFGVPVWESGKKEKKKTYILAEEQEQINAWCGKAQGFYWISALKNIENSISWKRQEKARQNRSDRLKDREENTPELPEGLEEWISNTLFRNKHFLYYKRHGRYADIACSACGRVNTILIKRPDSFEGQFRRVLNPPENGKTGTCPMCGAMGTWKAKGKTKGVYREKRACFIGQKYKEHGAVIRYLQAGKIYKLDLLLQENEEIMIKAEEHYIISELSRWYFEPGKKRIQKDYHKYDGYLGRNFWDDCNLYGMQKIEPGPGMVYPETWEMLNGTVLQYSGAKEYRGYDPMANLMEYMERYTQYPQIEFLSKMHMFEVVRNMLDCHLGMIINTEARNAADFLGIYKHRVRLLMDAEGDLELLRGMQYEKQFNLHLAEEELRFISFLKYEAKVDPQKALEYQSIKKLKHKLEQWSGTGFSMAMCGHADRILRSTAILYFDYLDMREKTGYDLRNTVYLWPKNLKEEHDRLALEISDKETEDRMRDVEERFPDIRKNYRKLRQEYFYEDEQFMIRPVRSASEIIQEGRFQHHCVARGDGYLDKHNKGISYILLLRTQEHKDIPYITIEISEKRIVQWYGAYDKKPDKEIIEPWLDQYLRMLKTGTLVEKLAQAM